MTDQIKLVNYTCSHCQKEINRPTVWISPSKFANKPIMRITEWCPSCTLSNTITVRFIESTKNIKVTSVENTANIIGTTLEQNFPEEKEQIDS